MARFLVKRGSMYVMEPVSAKKVNSRLVMDNLVMNYWTAINRGAEPSYVLLLHLLAEKPRKIIKTGWKIIRVSNKRQKEATERD
jgi:hypothetical protein